MASKTPSDVMPASELVAQVFSLGGKIVLELRAADPKLSLSLPNSAAWLRDEIKRRKPEVVAEMATRYLRGWESGGKVIQ